MVDTQTNDIARFPGQVRVGILDGSGAHHDDNPVIRLTPQFQLFFFLQGEQQFYIDDVYFNMRAGDGPDCTPRALIMNRVRNSTLRHVPRPGRVLRKVMISAPASWVEDLQLDSAARSPEISAFVSGHLNHFFWQPQKHVVKLAEEIAHPPPAMQGEMRELYQKARALELMCLACAALIDAERNVPRRATLSTWRQSERVRDYLLDHLDETLTIEQIARDTGASASTVQRHFKEHFGETVFEFIRARRLEKAREALERQGATIAQAAYIAGYANPSNFTTAFKRVYGVPPKHRRA